MVEVILYQIFVGNGVMRIFSIPVQGKIDHPKKTVFHYHGDPSHPHCSGCYRYFGIFLMVNPPILIAVISELYTLTVSCYTLFVILVPDWYSIDRFHLCFSIALGLTSGKLPIYSSITHERW